MACGRTLSIHASVGLFTLGACFVSVFVNNTWLVGTDRSVVPIVLGVLSALGAALLIVLWFKGRGLTGDQMDRANLERGDRRRL